jgi:hypothetical protein
MCSNHLHELLFYLNVILLQVSIEVFSAKNPCDLDELVIVVLTLEEWLSVEEHSSEHASETPDVERVVVKVVIDEELRSLEVPGSYSYVVILSWVVKLGETPIDESEPSFLVIDHDVVRLDVSMDDSL